MRSNPLKYAPYLCSVTVGGLALCDTCLGKELGSDSSALFCTGETLFQNSGSFKNNIIERFDRDARPRLCAVALHSLPNNGFVLLVDGVEEGTSAESIALGLEAHGIQNMREVLVLPKGPAIVRFADKESADACAFEFAERSNMNSNAEPDSSSRRVYRASVVDYNEWVRKCRDSQHSFFGRQAQVIFCGDRIVKPKPSRDPEKKVVCPNGHLFELTTEHSWKLCEICRKSVGPSHDLYLETGSYRCNRCDYDFCRSCYRARGGDIHDDRVQRERSPVTRELQSVRERHERHWGKGVDWSPFVKICCASSVANVSDILRLLSPLRCRKPNVVAYAILDGVGYAWFRHRVAAQKLAQEAYECSGKEGTSLLYLDGTCTFHLEPLSEDEWVAVLSQLPDDFEEGVQPVFDRMSKHGHAKAMWAWERRLLVELEKKASAAPSVFSASSSSADGLGSAAMLFSSPRIFKFKPGKMGINYSTQDGWIRKVSAGGQACALGLKADWVIIQVEGQPFSSEAMNKVLTYRRQYSITVETDFKVCRSLRGMDLATGGDVPSEDTLAAIPSHDSAPGASEQVLGEASCDIGGKSQSKDLRKDVPENSETFWNAFSSLLRKVRATMAALRKRLLPPRASVQHLYVTTLQQTWAACLQDMRGLRNEASAKDLLVRTAQKPVIIRMLKNSLRMAEEIGTTLQDADDKCKQRASPLTPLRLALAKMEQIIESFNEVAATRRRIAKKGARETAKRKSNGSVVSVARSAAGKANCGHLQIWSKAFSDARRTMGLAPGARILKGTPAHKEALRAHARLVASQASCIVESSVLPVRRKRFRSKMPKA